MAIKSRINKRTGKEEYAWRYYIVENGKKKDTNTAYFKTKAEAEAEGKRIEEARALNLELSEGRRRDKKLETAFKEFIEEYREKANRRTTDNTSTDNSFYHRAITIQSKYMTEGIKRTRIADIEPLVFRDWITYINSQDISGSYVRSLKATILLFNRWLRDNGYYYMNRNLDMEIAYAITNTTIKSKKVKNRELKGERNILTTQDIDNICQYFFDKGIGKFENFYFYTMYYVLFYSGLRIEELVALQWKFIDLDVYGVMHIENAITDKEKRENVMDRISQGIYHTKNSTSKRILPILENYRELLIDYRTSYKYEFDIKTKEELNECFVFPMLLKHNPRMYMNPDMPTKKLKEPLKMLGLKNTDGQMFRHSCATFLIMPKPEGLGYKEEEVIDYFGHTDEEMLKTVYARLDMKQKSERLKQTFGEYYKMKKTKEALEQEEIQKKRIENMKGNRNIARKVRKERIIAEIENAISKKQKTYYYNKKDKWAIDECKKNYTGVIRFVQEKE